MVNIETKELDKKLAKWAGFTKFGWENWDLWQVPNEKPPIDISLRELYPNSYAIPAFHKDLNACYRWLVPKLLDGTGLDIELFSDCGFYFCHLHRQGKSYKPPIYASIVAEETPSMAVCRATEAFIKQRQ